MKNIMKFITVNKVTVCVIIFMALLTCINVFINCAGKTTNQEQNIHRLDSIGQDTIVSTQVLTFEYNGDKYIEFIRDDRSYVVHDPKCKCMSNKLNNITTVINKKTAETDENNRKNFRIIIDKLNELEAKVNRQTVTRTQAAITKTAKTVAKTTPAKKKK